MGKGQTVRLTEQSTHTEMGKQVPVKSVSSTLLELNRKAGRDRKYRFRSLYREIDLRMLYDSFALLKRNAAPGADQVSYDDYEKDLDANLRRLLYRLVNQSYRSKQIRRKWIPKVSGKLRPLGVPCLEDKIVQMSARRLLEAIYEADFLDSSMGYRPNRGARQASKKLRDELFYEGSHWIVEADIKGFFDHMNHDWLIKMLEQRINDSHFIRLIRKWLKAGIVEEDGSIYNPITGTPQGGIISPILANIYLHYALDLWVEKLIKNRSRGKVVYLRYADDFVLGFEHGSDARRCFSELGNRLVKFDLELSMAKSNILRFSRCDLDHSKRFCFLGFDFYWSRTRRGKYTIKRRTNKEKYRAALQSIKSWIKTQRHTPLKVLKGPLASKFKGHFNYYGVIGNSEMISNFYNEARWIIYRALNNRSQRKSYNWKSFKQMWKTLDIPRPKVLEQIRTQTPC